MEEDKVTLEMVEKVRKSMEESRREEFKDRLRRCRMLYVSDEIILELMKGNVKVSGVPDGSDVSAVYYDFTRKQFALKVNHPNFEQVPEGDMIPYLEDVTVTKESASEIDKLSKFILDKYPDEIGVGDPVHGESAVEVAIRLLEKFYTTDHDHTYCEGCNRCVRCGVFAKGAAP